MSLASNRPDSADGSEHFARDQRSMSLASPDSGIGGSRFFRGRHSGNASGYGESADDYDNTPRRLSHASTPYHRGGFRNSRTWMSPDTKHLQDFIIIRNAMRRLFKQSDVSKWRLADYIAHREAVIASDKARLDRKLKAYEEEQQRQLARSPEDEEYTQAVAHVITQCLHFDENRSLVLGEKTIWCRDWQNGKEEIAPWPTFAEMKWEGDDRAKTGVGRFLPLPREMGAPGITWSQLQVIEQYPLDQVAQIPTMEDIYLPVDEIDDEVKYSLITRELEEAMDAYLET
jgi:hypothetical protein